MDKNELKHPFLAALIAAVIIIGGIVGFIAVLILVCKILFTVWPPLLLIFFGIIIVLGLALEIYDSEYDKYPWQ